MKVIFKYEINELLPVSVIEAPVIEPLKVDYQNGHPFVWMVVDTALPPRKIHLYRVGTGVPIDDDVALGLYINTTVSQSEPYVWHWFWDEV